MDGGSLWLGFNVLVGALLALDLFVLNRHSRLLTMKEAATWSACLVACALAFGLVIHWRQGAQHALEYYTGYIIELSLSVDNLFVFLLIFRYFGVPPAQQPRVLKWGILGAIVLRGVMIAAGTLIVQRFTWVIYVFGAVLVITGLKMLRETEIHVDPERNPVVRLVCRVMPFTTSYDGERFLTRGPRGWMGTPLLLVLLVIDWFDLVFAIDSIPAIFAVTQDGFIVYSSNVFAILGLRAMFFVLAGMMDRFYYLKPGVALILTFVGGKMLLSKWVHIPILLSLLVIVGMLVVAVVCSMLRKTAPAAANGGPSDAPRPESAPAAGGASEGR